MLINKIYRRLNVVLLSFKKLHFRLLSTAEIEGEPKMCQPFLAIGNGKIKFERNVQIGYYPSPLFYSGYTHFDTRGQESRIEIGESCYINNSASFIADNATIRIGKDLLAGTNLTIYTSDFHSIDPMKRLSNEYPCIDVIIEDNVFIGSNVTILKGSKIGQNSVIACGSIVSGTIPENVLAGGVPCKVLKNI